MSGELKGGCARGDLKQELEIYKDACEEKRQAEKRKRGQKTQAAQKTQNTPGGMLLKRICIIK